jgi:MFS family permease
MTSVVYVCAWGTLNVGFPAFAVSVHAGAHAGGYLWAAISLGSMISAFAFRGQARRLTPRVLMACSFSAMALSVAAWPLAHGIAAALALVTLTGLLEGPSLVALIAIRQRLAPPQLRNQVFSTVSSLNLAAAALGAAAAGPLHAVAGTAATLLAFAILIALAGVIALATGPRGERDPSPSMR